MTVTDRLPLVSPVAPLALRFALLAAPCAWIAQGLLVWWIGARLCRPLSVGTARGLAGAVSIVALGIAVAGVAIGLRQWRRVRGDGDSAGPTGSVAQFAAMASVFISAAFAVGILWAGLSSLWPSGCGAMR
jgi:hypothetical protein